MLLGRTRNDALRGGAGDDRMVANGGSTDLFGEEGLTRVDAIEPEKGAGQLRAPELNDRGLEFRKRFIKTIKALERSGERGLSLGEIAVLEDEYERRRRELEAAFWKEERESLEELVAPVDELCEAAEVLARAALLAAGYRRHNRGEWRKRRGQQES